MGVVIEPFRENGIVYGLHDGDGVIRYVGQTTRLKARITEHLVHARTGRHGNAALAAWLLEVEDVYVRVLSQVPADQLDVLEQSYIGLYAATAMNVPQAARRGHAHTETSRAKISAGNTGPRHHQHGKRSYYARFSDAEVAEFRRRVAAGERRADLAREVGCSRSAMERAVAGVTYR